MEPISPSRRVHFDPSLGDGDHPSMQPAAEPSDQRITQEPIALETSTTSATQSGVEEVDSRPQNAAGPEETHFTIFHGEQQPAPEHRLRQIKNFLADEDVFRYPRAAFLEHLAEIEEYIYDLENNIWDFDADMVKDIKQMIDVHRHWIAKETEIPDIDLSVFSTRNQRPFSLRLAQLSTNPQNLTRRLELLVKATKHLREPQKSRGTTEQKLPRGSPLCLSIDPSKLPDEPDPFEYTKKLNEFQATRRAVYAQIRDEMIQRHKDDPSFVPPPINDSGPYMPIRREQIVAQKKARYDRLLQVVDDLMTAHCNAPRPLLGKVLELADEGFRLPAPRDVPDGSRPGYHGRTSQWISENDLASLEILTEESWTANTKPLSDSDPSRNFKLTWFYHEMMLIFKGDEFSLLGGDEGLTVKGLCKAITKRWKIRNTESGNLTGLTFSFDEGMRYILQIVNAKRFRYSEEVVNGENQTVIRRPILDAHPEQRFVNIFPSNDFETVPDIQGNASGEKFSPKFIAGYDFLFTAAERLGRELTELRSWFEAGERGLDDTATDEQSHAIEEIEDILRDHGEKFGTPTLADIARGLQDPDSERLSEAAALELIRENVLEEQHLNLEPREPNYGELWGWARDLPRERMTNGEMYQFFSLQRWPVEIQRPDIQAQVRASGPQAQLKEDAGEAERRVDIGKGRDEFGLIGPVAEERHFPGDSAFPFGETGYQRAHDSRRLESELRNAPEFAQHYRWWPKTKERLASLIDLFALPSLSEHPPTKITKSIPVTDIEATRRDIEEAEIELENLASRSEQMRRQTIGGNSRKRPGGAQGGRAMRRRQSLDLDPEDTAVV